MKCYEQLSLWVDHGLGEKIIRVRKYNLEQKKICLLTLLENELMNTKLESFSTMNTVP